MSGENESSTSSLPTPPPKEEKTGRRDRLREIELEIQAKWERDKVYECNPMTNPDGSPRPSYIATFPYPYMNGRLHLGHAYSLTKAEFAVRFHRLLGENAIFPFGFHCTGMPIQAAANKLKAEMEKFGCPPQFPVSNNTEKDGSTSSNDSKSNDGKKENKKESAEELQSKKTKGKKSKAVSKAGNLYQWQILEKMVPKDEIPQFSEPLKWLNYFPPWGIHDLKAFYFHLNLQNLCTDNLQQKIPMKNY